MATKAILDRSTNSNPIVDEPSVNQDSRPEVDSRPKFEPQGKMPATTRHGRVRMNALQVETLIHTLGYDIVSMKDSGKRGTYDEITLIDPATRVKKATVPPVGFLMRVTNGPSGNTIRRATAQASAHVTVEIGRELSPYKYTDNFVRADYSLPDLDFFDRDTIYVVDQDTMYHLMAACLYAGQSLPAIFAVAEKDAEVKDDCGHVIGYEYLVVYDPEGRTLPANGSQIVPKQDTLPNF